MFAPLRALLTLLLRLWAGLYFLSTSLGRFWPCDLEVGGRGLGWLWPCRGPEEVDHLGFLAEGKVFYPAEFLKVVREYGIFGPGQHVWLNATAALVPWIELTGGVFLVLGLLRRGTALALAGLTLAFTGAVAWRAMQVAGETGLSFCAVEFDCGCGTGVEAVCPKLLANGVLLLACLLVALSDSDFLSLDGRRQARREED